MLRISMALLCHPFRWWVERDHPTLPIPGQGRGFCAMQKVLRSGGFFFKCSSCASCACRLPKLNSVQVSGTLCARSMPSCPPTCTRCWVILEGRWCPFSGGSHYQGLSRTMQNWPCWQSSMSHLPLRSATPYSRYRFADTILVTPDLCRQLAAGHFVVLPDIW